MQAVGFIEKPSFWCFAFSFFFFAFFFLSLYDMMRALGAGSEGVYFFGGVHYTWKLQSFAFCLQGNMHENTIFLISV